MSENQKLRDALSELIEAYNRAGPELSRAERAVDRMRLIAAHEALALPTAAPAVPQGWPLGELSNGQIIATVGRMGELVNYLKLGQQWDGICNLVRQIIRERYTLAATPAPAPAQESAITGEADVWHEGSKSFYRATLLHKLTPEEVFSEPPELDAYTQPAQEAPSDPNGWCQYVAGMVFGWLQMQEGLGLTSYDEDRFVEAIAGIVQRRLWAHKPAQEVTLTGCNCRWDGSEQVQWCELHLAHKDAIHEWAERAKTAEAKLDRLSSNQEVGLTEGEIQALGHRIATTYRHDEDGFRRQYAFNIYTLVDFANAIIAALRAKGGK